MNYPTVKKVLADTKPKVEVIDSEDPEYDQIAKVDVDGSHFEYGGFDAREAIKGLRGLLKDAGIQPFDVDWGDWDNNMAKDLAPWANSLV